MVRPARALRARDHERDRRPEQREGEDNWYFPDFSVEGEMHVFPPDPYVESGSRLEPQYAKWAISDFMSNVTLWHASEYHHLIHTLLTLQFQECTKHERITSRPIKGWVPFYAEFLKIGICFPLPLFLLEVLDYNNTGINHLTPNSMRYVLAFITNV